jgi:hypothetical protein
MDTEKQLKHDLALACGLLPNKDEPFILMSWDNLFRLVLQIRKQRDQALEDITKCDLGY